MYIVFSDLDGTLLDHNTYSYEKSLEGMDILRNKDIPLVLVSSKTFDEMKLLHQELGLSYPFIFENGGGFSRLEDGEYTCELSGRSSAELDAERKFLEEIMGSTVYPLTLMSVDEIAALTGLTPENAQLARMRKASYPFVLETARNIPLNELKRINEQAQQRDLRVTRGGRFYHFSSINANKGYAMDKVVELFMREGGISSIETIAIGDSENDIPMLEKADRPFLVRKHDRSAIETGLENITITDRPGPEGFTEMAQRITKDE